MDAALVVTIFGFLIVVWITICILISKIQELKKSSKDLGTWHFGCICIDSDARMTSYKVIDSGVADPVLTSKDLDLFKDSVLIMYPEFKECLIISAMRLKEDGCNTNS